MRRGPPLAQVAQMKRLRKLQDVTRWRLCLGCGACRWFCPQQAIRLVEFPAEGIRPVVDTTRCGADCTCLHVCPVVASEFFVPAPLPRNGVEKEWGPILELWEGHATDPQIRYSGSSGGALTAIAAYCLEKRGMEGVLHIGADFEDPLRNRTYLSRSRGDLLQRTGSRYAPASVCDRLDWVEAAQQPCVVIGRPVEIAALRNAERLRPGLRAKVGVALSFFCAESPASAGTAALLQRLGVAPSEVEEVRYRGCGWPGEFTVRRRGEAEPSLRLNYQESWGFLQAYRPWAAHLWPDGTGELADISCGDPWYEAPDGSNPGFSLIVVRTERGREILHGAMAAGYLDLKRAELWKLEKSQAGLLEKKGAIWGRRLALRMLGLPVTEFRGLDLFHCWKRLPFKAKVKSVLGTLRRVLLRKLYRPVVFP